MRVVEPNSFNHPKEIKRKSSMPRMIIGIAILLFIASSLIFMSSKRADSPQTATEINNNLQSSQSTLGEQSGPIEFSGNEFRLLYDNLTQPNLKKVDVPPYITGDDIADTRIRQIAEKRGYRLRNSPINALTNVDGYPLQKEVHKSWLDLKENARAEGISMSVTSAFRSVNDQRALFLARLRAEGVNTYDVAKGNADKQIDTVLVTTAVPGYSKHHTGYTIDLSCAGYVFENFKNSPCNDWLIANNYEKAKSYGFIPSYPIDADLQGPDPEAWEYVFVGADVLYW